MSGGARPALVGRRFLSVTGSSPPKLKNLYDWDWRAGWIRSSSSSDVDDQELQLLLEYDELSWKERDWFSVYSSNSVANFPFSEERRKEKDTEKDKKRKRRKTDTDSEDEEKEEFQIFCVEERLTVAHRPNYQGSSTTSGTLYPALVFKALVDKPDLFKTKKLPVEFLSDHKLVFQEYSHLKTVSEWEPSTPGLAVCTRSESEVRKWCEDVAAQRILLTTPSVLVGERLSVYRVEGTTQWYSAFIIGHNQESGEFTVTDDTVLEEHLENPELVQMRILGDGVVQSILRGETISAAPRRSRASAYRDRPTPKISGKQNLGNPGGRVKNRQRSSSATNSGKLKPRAKRRVSSESPQKNKTTPERKFERKSKFSIKSPSSTLEPEDNSNSTPSLSEDPAISPLPLEVKPEVVADSPPKVTLLNPDPDVIPSLPIRLPTKCKPKTDSDSDSDSRSTKSSTSSSSKVSKSIKKTFKGKAIAIVKPFSNPVTEKKSPTNEKQKEIEARLNLYDFGSDEDRDSAERVKVEESSDKDSLDVTSEIVSQNNPSSSISSIKGIKQIKSVKQGLLSSRRLKLNPELKSVRVRVEKLRNNSGKGDKLKTRQSLTKNKDSSEKSKHKARLKGEEKCFSSEKVPSISLNLSADSSLRETDKNQEKVFSEGESSLKTNCAEITAFRGNDANFPSCKEELATESLIPGNEDSDKDLDKLVPSSLHRNNIESVSSDIKPVFYNSDSRRQSLSDDKLIEIVKSELFSQPSSLSTESVKVKPEKLISERNEDCHQRNRMEDDTRSDSGVSTLRSDGARSSGDERSGSRSSALSDDRSGSRPSASASAEPDIKIVGTVPGIRELSSHTSVSPPGHTSLPLHHRSGSHQSDPYSYRQKQESAEDRYARAVSSHSRSSGAMADPRHAAAMSPLSGAQLSALAAAAHYPGVGAHATSLPSHLMPQAALLQYQQLATAAALAGIPADALLKQNYPGLGASLPGHLHTNSHPATELLLERERQIAQERDRALRERREQEQRERDRLDKERAERERRDREERDRKERERVERERKMRELEIQKERERQAVEDVNRHFELSMELAKKKMIGGAGGWNLPGHKLEDDHQRRVSVHYNSRPHPPPAHSSLAPAKSPSLYSGYKSDPKHDQIRGAPAGFRAEQSYGVSKSSSPSPGPYHHQSHRGPSPHHSTSPHPPHPAPSPNERYPGNYKSGYPAAHSPHPPRIQLGSPSPLSSYSKSSSLISPSAKSDPGQTRPPSSGPPPAHGGSKALGVHWPPHRLTPPRPASATSLPPPTPNGEVAPLDLGSNKRKSEAPSGQDSVMSQKSARIETLSPTGQLHRVTEPSTLGTSVLAAEATPITSVVNTAVVSTECVTSLPSEELNIKSDEKSSEEIIIKSEEKHEAESSKPPEEFKYVHKLKKAWIKNFVAEPDNENSTKLGGSSVSTSTSSSGVTSPQLHRSTPSPAGSTKSTSSNKGFPSAVKSASEDLKLNGHDNDQENDEDDDLSSDNEETKPVDKPRARSKPGPKPKGKPGPKSGRFGQSRKKNRSESDNSDSEKDSDSSKTSKKSEFANKKRGRKPGPKKRSDVEEPKTKKLKAEEVKTESDPFAKPPVSQLKKTGDSFLQDASCFEVAPKLNKCRECRGSLAQRQKQTMANIFCRFYAFRRLRYTKNGQLAVAGFCDPKQDAQIEDLKLWLPSQDLSPKNMDKKNARLILANLTSQFYSIYKQEQEAELYAEDLTPAWKRVVQGVREMCDVCEATLFNKHWACGKCGFVVCIDCYRARVNGQGATPSGADTDTSATKDKDDFAWLLCNNNKSHQLDTLMLTQIIAGDALDEVNNKLRVLSKLNSNNGNNSDNGWENPDKSNVTKSPLFRDETDVKEEKDEDNNSSTLRDLLSSDQRDEDSLLGWGDTDVQVKAMHSVDTSSKFEAKHQWLCGGIVLKLENPSAPDNIELFKTVWKRSQPVIVAKVGQSLDNKLWQPSILSEIPDHNHDPAFPDTSAVTHGQTIKTFFDGYNNISKRPVGDNGEILNLRFKENWPSQEDHFAELLPNQYKDLMENLPLREYTSREGVLNLASRLPDCFVRLDLGPRLWGGYSKATYNLQYNVSDAVHVMVHSHKDSKSEVVMDVLKSSGCDIELMKLAETNSNKIGALWHVFHPKDAEKIKEFVNANIKDPKKKPRDPLWIGTIYLKEKLLEKLKSEHGIQPWTLTQCQGDGIIIPSGAPYQVKILNSSVYVQSEFVSPEHMKDSMKLSFSDVLNDDRLQVKNVVFHACKDALSVLENPKDSLSEK